MDKSFLIDNAFSFLIEHSLNTWFDIALLFLRVKVEYYEMESS